jgi:phosphoribosyl 1,2-cyclic phosphate phosphodiesterase
VKTRILGCGTSSGVPRIGNDWGACNPHDPRNSRLRSSILVDSGGERLLVDCGPDLRQQLLAAGVGAVDRAIVTHAHADHCHGIDDLRQVAANLGRPVPLLARAETLDRLRSHFPYAFEGATLYRPTLDPQLITNGLLHGTIKLRFVDQPHGSMISLGMRFDEGHRSAAYAIDFHDLTEEMAALYEGVDLWIAGCVPNAGHPTHAHLDAVLGWAKDLMVGQLLLTHLDKSLDYATLAKALPDWAAPAFDGQELTA